MSLVAGTSAGLDAFETPITDLGGTVNSIVDWILA